MFHILRLNFTQSYYLVEHLQQVCKLRGKAFFNSNFYYCKIRILKLVLNIHISIFSIYLRPGLYLYVVYCFYIETLIVTSTMYTKYIYISKECLESNGVIV